MSGWLHRMQPGLIIGCSLFNSVMSLQNYLLVFRFRSSVLRRRGCVYNDGEGKGECREPSLPGTRHCMRHIMYNVDQQLFTHCTARQPDNTLCRIPVFDVAHELPLCYNHSKTQVSIWTFIAVQ